MIDFVPLQKYIENIFPLRMIFCNHFEIVQTRKKTHFSAEETERIYRLKHLQQRYEINLKVLNLQSTLFIFLYIVNNTPH